jgi:hypothetical protein
VLVAALDELVELLGAEAAAMSAAVGGAAVVDLLLTRLLIELNTLNPVPMALKTGSMHPPL